ncbi:MAG: Stk1 family PASTA domain-containing Ser/Thr kinase [Clostridia bacterium]|nr:Stk1 family PASTA domain-containing Ser/Thr kinase [Clostridia bacterium]
MDLVGKFIGNRYEIIEKIGNGGMATVYKAKCHVLNRYVAVKVLKDEYTTDAEFIRRFNAEAQSAAGLTHANIVSVYDVGHEDNIYYIVMELIQGKTLKQIINQDGSLPWKWSVNIAIQIASALEAAHRNNIVHRDIKPHNIIITEDGIAKVTDFGIAKAVSNSTITAFGTTIGSVHYFSPEHAKGGFTDAKSDLYSLGVVMYEMLTGRVPFDADTPVSVALKHMQEKPVEPIKLNPSIPFAVNQIIIKAMEKEPSLRYQNATEMIKDLGMALKNPEGKFVEEIDDTMRTRVINMPEEKETTRKNKKKKNKLARYFEEHPKAKIPVIILSCIVLFILTIFITKGLMDMGTVRDVPIPELVGKTEEEIKDLFKNTKFTYEIIGEEYDSEIEEGKVISQEPKYRKNYTIKENSKFQIVISKGTKIVEMIKVEGEKIEDARRMIEELDANLEIEIIEEESTKVEEGIVLKQSIQKGEQVQAGIKITLTVSKAKEQVSVPYVIGKTEDQAKKELTDSKLKVEVVYEEDTSKDAGKVLKQSIDVGKTVDVDTVVTITVNKIAEMKQGTVTVNVKSLLNYTPETDEDGNEIIENAQIKIVAGNDTIYNEKKPKTTTNITAKFSSKGTITVKVYIDDVLKGTKEINMNSTTTCTFE